MGDSDSVIMHIGPYRTYFSLYLWTCSVKPKALIVDKIDDVYCWRCILFSPFVAIRRSFTIFQPFCIINKNKDVKLCNTFNLKLIISLLLLMRIQPHLPAYVRTCWCPLLSIWIFHLPLCWLVSHALPSKS